jgi:hypothetical protein
MKINNIFLSFLFILFFFKTNAQSFNSNKISLLNSIKRKYYLQPFEGVNIEEGYDAKYLISVISVDNIINSSLSKTTKVAKRLSEIQVSEYLNGSVIYKNIKQYENDSTNVIIVSKGINELELLSNFPIEDGRRMLFIYYMELKY